MAEENVLPSAVIEPKEELNLMDLLCRDKIDEKNDFSEAFSLAGRPLMTFYPAGLSNSFEDDNEEEMIKNKQKLQSNKIEITIREYDKEMIENTQQFDRETKAFMENKHSLEATENLIREIRMEKTRREEEEKKDSAKRANFEQMQKQKDVASAYIASHWKGLKTRQDYEKLKKSKKKRRGKK